MRGTVVTSLADGRLASGSADYTAKVWDLSKPKGQQCVATLVGHTSAVWSITPLTDGRLVSCSFDNTVRVWDLNKVEGELAYGSADKTVKEQV